MCLLGKITSCGFLFFQNSSTAKAGFKQPGFKEQAGFKQLFLATGILLSKKLGKK